MSTNIGKPRKKKMAPEDIVFTICNTIFMVLFAVVTLYPILNTLAISFNEGNDAVRGGIHLLPRVWSLKSYSIVIHKEGIIQGAKHCSHSSLAVRNSSSSPVSHFSGSSQCTLTVV